MSYLLPLNLLDKEDHQLVGTKGANLGELKKAGLPIPQGFVVTTEVYQEVVVQAGVQKEVEKILSELLPTKPEKIIETSSKIAKVFDYLVLPKKLNEDILREAKILLGKSRENLVVRSSAISEDVKGLSFAGEYASFLDVSLKTLPAKIKACWASQFSPRAISYTQEHKIDLKRNSIAVIVQDFIEAQSSGAGFTINPLNGDKNEIIIEAIWGLGSLANYGMVIPDRYIVSKNNLQIISKTRGSQKIQLVCEDNIAKEIPISKAFQTRYKLGDEKITELAKLAKIIEGHFYFPQNFEWALSKGKLFILQSRPIAPDLQTSADTRQFQLPVILKGTGASKGCAWGQARIIKKMVDLKDLRAGDILITASTNPNFILGMKKASAIITDRGGLTSHAAILARELGKPCVVGVGEATRILKNGKIITVEGTSGKIFSGQPHPLSKILTIDKNDVEKHNSHQSSAKTAQKIYCYLPNLDELKKAIEQGVAGFYIANTQNPLEENLLFSQDIRVTKDIILAINSSEINVFPKYNIKNFNLALFNTKSRREIKEATKRIGNVFLVVNLPFQLFAYKELLEEKIKGVIIDIFGLIKGSLGEIPEDELEVQRYITNSNFIDQLAELISEAKKRRLRTFLLFKNNFYWEFLDMAVKKGVWGIIVPEFQIPTVSEILHGLEEENVKNIVPKPKGEVHIWRKLPGF